MIIIKQKVLHHIFVGTAIEGITLNNSYLPVYYNAWLYDNHTDPLMSLLYVIVKKCGIFD